MATTAIKRRREAAEQMRGGGREELAQKEEQEAAILQAYLPPQLGEDEVRAMVREAIAAGASDIGAVMKAVSPRTKGQFDGRELNRITRETLAGRGGSWTIRAPVAASSRSPARPFTSVVRSITFRCPYCAARLPLALAAARQMPSRALRHWQTRSRKVLDKMEAAHGVVGGGRGARRFARQQIAQAYVVLLCSQFQCYCRNLHEEAVDRLTSNPAHDPLNNVLRSVLSTGRRLDAGNASRATSAPTSAGSAFRSGTRCARNVRNVARQRTLEQLNGWRNAIAHHDFRHPILKGAHEVTLADVRRWRRCCDALAVDFDGALRLYLHPLLGRPPW